ncbi:MAG: 2,3,4,5-tetrahydropyridine-2,6-dicarboxylate N-acetyltransferase [Erysipelotrichales bacterium]|nr:2,3,4,5-tetrahydropyridine-2,6-dicarboxylate N-acetyltransferase [Erysipelotrichales bacterium]
MESQEMIRSISQSRKRTPVKVFLEPKGITSRMRLLKAKRKHLTLFRRPIMITGEYEEIKGFIERNEEDIRYIEMEYSCKNSALPLLDILEINARIEPGAIIREGAVIHEHAVILMGAVINTGAVIGEKTMIDMGAIIGGRAMIGKNCHIGANSVIAGVLEPMSVIPCVIEDDVMIGANAVILEGVRVGKGSVIGAGSIVLQDVPANSVVVGNPGRVIKEKDEKTVAKSKIVEELREL